MRKFLFVFAVLSVFLFPATQAFALTSGTTTTGSIIPGGSQHQSFSGDAGQGVLLYAHSDSYTVVITIYKPDGSYWTFGENRKGLTLPVSGTYDVVISALNSYDSGSYSLSYLRGSDTVSSGSLTSGQTSSGTVATDGIASYQFTGTAGQGILLYVQPSFTATIIVYKPDGSLWNSTHHGRYDGTLPDTGTYTVAVTPFYADGGGNYGLEYLLGGSTVSSGTLTSGQTFNGSFDANGLNSFQFTGDAGQGVKIYAQADYLVDFKIYKPDGTYWTYGEKRRFSGTLPVSGTYTVAVNPYYVDSSGSYSLQYVRGSAGVSNGTLTSGKTVSGTLLINGLNSYQFTGTAGQGVLIYAQSAYLAHFSVYNPDGSLWSETDNSRFSGILPVTGTYTVVLNPYYNTSGGAYTLQYVRAGGDVANGKLKSGTTTSGSIDVNGIASFTFEGTAGERAYIYFNGSFYAPVLNIYKPSGSLWTSKSAGRVGDDLPETGTYTVTLVPYHNSEGGDYSVAYLKGADNVSEGTVFNGVPRTDYLPANEIKSYVFSGTAGGHVSGSVTGNGHNYMTILKPDGSYWTYGHNGVTSHTLPVTGQYILIVAGYYVTTTGDYTVNLTVTASPPVPATVADKVGQPCVPCDVSPTPLAGDPANFDVGYQTESATDYDAGGLSFTRVYRSDSTWTDNTIGDLWRTNYARTLTVTGGTTASITDGTGAVTSYTKSGSDWVPDDADTTATLTDDGSGGYVYTLPNNTVERYDSSKLLTRIEYLGGGALNLAYNGSSQLTSVTNENGRALTFTYASGRIATMATPDGTFSYAYDTNGNLETVTKPDTKTVVYHYEDTAHANALTGITDESGTRYATFTYDTNGKAVQSKLAGNVGTTDIDYNTGQTSTTTNALSQSSDFYYTNILGVRKIVQETRAATAHTAAASRYYNYDEKGRLIGQTDWQGNITRYQYDARGNITQITRGTGTADQQITNITYDATFNLPDIVSETGKTTDYDYDAYGRLTSKTVTDTNTSEARITAYTYYANTTDPNGNLVLGRLHTVDGPRTDVSDITTYTYDTNLDLKTVTNPLSQVTTIVTRDTAGRPTEITDANGTETDLTYDTNGRLHTSVAAVGTALAATTTYDYDDDGSLAKVTQPNGAYLQYSYDDAQRLTGIEDALGNTITYTLDNAGNITQEDIKDTSSTLKYTHQKVFDALSRIIQSVGASSQTANYAYDNNGNLTTYTDPDTNATAYAYDAIQRLVTQTDALSGVVTNGYDQLDNLTSVQDQRSNTTSYTYNAFGDVLTEASPDRGTMSFTTDKAGNVTQRTDARGVVTNYTYDALNRLLTVSYPSDSSLNETLTYDSTSGCGTAYKGHLCSVSDAAGGTAYQYDVLGRVTQQTDTRNGHALTTAYTYDLAGNIATITLPSGRVVTYTRNANGQVSSVSADVNSTATTLASSITYLPFGPMNALTYGNSLTLSATYDQDYNPTNRTVSGGIANWTYTTDDNGNVTQAGSATYGYDALNRINAENPGTSTSYTYDATSNRLTKDDGTTTTTTVPTDSNKISAVGASSYTYDDNGNITDDGVNTYTWNAANQLATVNTTAGVYTYNWLNQRSEKVTASGTTYFVYGPGGLPYGEYDSSGTMIREYVYLNGEPLAQIDSGSPEVLTYLHTDHLGTPRYATNTSGAQVWSWNNDAFGVSTPSGSVTVNLRMPGQYFDVESGLFYNINRYYNPEIGRYISSDPIGIDGGLNTFSYAEQNPVNSSDPSGLAPTDVCRASYISTCTAIGGTIGYTTGATGGTLVLPGFGTIAGAETLGAGGAIFGAATGNVLGNMMCPAVLNSKAPENAKDPNGPKAPGKPGESEGFKDPKGGEKWVPNPNGAGYGWEDAKGNVWVPTGPAGAPGTGTTGPAHGGPHWDVQRPGGGYDNVRPGQKLP
jgi:RHS repeat-associated protein